MKNHEEVMRQALEACPFCGNEPSFSGDASEWKDESRYVELSLGCCVTMTEQIGWRRARDMTHEAKTAELRSRLQLRWNTRAALAEKCSCGDRLAVQCPGEWEPGCDLGSNPKYVVQSELTEPVQEPWEHLKQYGYAPGSYMSRCHICDNLAYHVDKRAITCRPCAEERHSKIQLEAALSSGRTRSEVRDDIG